MQELHLASFPFQAGGRVQTYLRNTVLGARFDARSDFWEQASSLGGALQTYAQKLLDDASSTASSASEDIARFKQIITNVVSSTGQFHAEIRDAAHARGTNLEDVSDELGDMCMSILEEIKVSFPHPDQAPTHEDRKAMIHTVLQKVEDALVRLGVKYGLQEDTLRKHFTIIKPHIEELIVVTGDLIEQHPILAESLIFGGVALLLPESWLLRPLLSLFGFGPCGPIKGSAAAWAQRRFFGAIIPKGSWFSHLKRAGMKIVSPGTGKKIIGGIGAGIGIGGSIFAC